MKSRHGAQHNRLADPERIQYMDRLKQVLGMSYFYSICWFKLLNPMKLTFVISEFEISCIGQ